MKEDLYSEAVQKQLQLTLAKVQLPEQAVTWMEQNIEVFSSGQLNEIRTALCDGVALGEVEDYYTAELTAERMKTLRQRFLVGEEISLLFEQLTSKIQRLQQLSDDMSAASKKASEETESLKVTMNEELRLRDEKHSEMLNMILMQLKSVHGEQKAKSKSIFGIPTGQSKKDELRKLIEKGKFSPEQLQEITEAYSANLPSEQIEAIARPENSAQTMLQLRLLYMARNRYEVTTDQVESEKTYEPLQQTSTAELSEEDYDEYEEDYDESEEG